MAAESIEDTIRRIVREELDKNRPRIERKERVPFPRPEYVHPASCACGTSAVCPFHGVAVLRHSADAWQDKPA